MKVLFIDNKSSNRDQLVELTRITSNLEVEVYEYSHMQNLDLKDFAFAVLSGGHDVPVEGHEHKEYDAEIRLISTSKIPIIGICIGCELIAKAFGATLVNRHKEHDLITITRISDDPIFKEIRNFEVYESHKWHVTKLSNELEGLAISPHGYEIIKHKSKPIYGFQFHPEMSTFQSGGDELFKNAVGEILKR